MIGNKMRLIEKARTAVKDQDKDQGLEIGPYGLLKDKDKDND